MSRTYANANVYETGVTFVLMSTCIRAINWTNSLVTACNRQLCDELSAIITTSATNFS